MTSGISLNTSIFCSLARQDPFQEWLGQHSLELLASLRHAIEVGGCSAVRENMKFLVSVLQSNGQFEHLISFLMRRYPYVIRNSASPHRTRPSLPVTESHNKVFGFYNDRVLTYPRRMMLCDNDSAKLDTRVRNFTSDKIEPDFIMVDGCAYIEYFLPEDRAIISQIPMERRELNKYRERIKQCANV